MRHNLWRFCPDEGAAKAPATEFDKNVNLLCVQIAGMIFQTGSYNLDNGRNLFVKYAYPNLSIFQSTAKSFWNFFQKLRVFFEYTTERGAKALYNTFIKNKDEERHEK